MSVHITPFPALPEDTGRLAKAVFKRKGNVYLTIGDQLGALFDDVDFATLYAADGKPAVSPNLLALVLVLQFMENLPDRETADAVRSRIDWKYALHLPLADPGFDDSVLSEFRERLTEHETARRMFEAVLVRLQALGLLRKGGKQRTDASYVLGATQVLSRVQLVAETMRLALETLADERPEWLRRIALPHWYERYSLVLTGFRLPRAKEKQEALALEIGQDGFYLLDALAAADVPESTRQLPAVQVLAQVWQQQFEQQIDALDNSGAQKIKQAESESDPLKKAALIQQAIETQQQRSAAQSSLQVVDASGHGKPPAISLGELLRSRDAIINKIRLATAATGEMQDDLQQQLGSAASAAGFFLDEANADYTLTVTAKLDPAIVQQGWYWLRGTLELNLKDKNGKDAGVKRWPLKASSTTLEQTRQRLLNDTNTILSQELRGAVLGFAIAPEPSDSKPAKK